MENKKVNFFAIPVFSFVPTKYKELIKEKGGKIFGALLIAFLIIAIVNAVMLHSGFNEVKEMVDKNCPDFALVNGELMCDDVVEVDEDGVYFKIDCTTSGISMDEFKAIVEAKNVQSAFYCGAESAVMYSTSNGYQEFTYADLEKNFQTSISFSKDSLINNLLPIIESICVVVIIVGTIVVIGLHYLLCLILQLITGLVCSVAKKDIDSAPKFRLTVLARFAVYVVLWLIGLFVTIPGKFVVGLLLTVIYIIVIVALYKDDNIDNTEEVSYYEAPAIEDNQI